MKLTALAVVLLALGIVAGFALRQTAFEAEAKPPPPPPDAIEFTSVLGQFCSANSPTRFCEFQTTTPLDFDAVLTNLGGQGWQLVDVEVIDGKEVIVYTLSRPVP